ncbi:aminomethyltransferase [Sphingomonas sp. Leaf357]|uniref:CAF17-like 4Fe-4S cluster assembly/insertion protein YgfZ n=1 Tax=Sphingomonas sp. Leaf357 TaxID=1736350 RepID=UPI0006F232F5|nr:folate-binding protein YgfZ [Sphingomonas sp. Leaf357]KQS05156.1 aminomethyltransferase [Sphingomonas sp. Leaf357]
MPETTPATTLADRALLRISGEDVRGFLQGLVTADTNGPLPAWSALLSPQGKVLFDFLLWSDGDDILVDCEADQAEALARRLSIYKLRRPIMITRDESLAVHWSKDAGQGTPDPRLPELGSRWIAPASGPATGWPAYRLALGVTEGTAELGSDKTLWLECNARELHGVSFTKGCYVGQENTARMNYRSTVNRRLVVAPLTEPSDRTRITYPDLGLMVDHRRVDALGDAIIPDWMTPAL